MNIVRVLLGTAVALALVVGCGDDGGGGGNVATKLAACRSGSSGAASTKCSTCYESKCSSELKKCFGDDFNGGPCASYSSCINKAADPCKAQCVPNQTCLACVMGDPLTCQNAKCANE